MKYTFEIMKEYEDAFRGISVYSVSEDKKLMVDFVALEELEDAQKEIDEAYQRGLEEGKKATWGLVADASSAEYQRGLDDAWEATKKIALMDTETSENVTGYFGLFRIMENLTPMQAIEKLKAYEEQKADDEIEVGDVVEWDGDLFIVTYIASFGGLCGVAEDGATYDAVLPENVKKTGRHFDIADMLKGINWT